MKFIKPNGIVVCDRNIEKIPPTKTALVEHVKRAVLQSGFIWGHYMDVSPNLPDIATWGWGLEIGAYHPFRSALPASSAVCCELIKSRCKKGLHSITSQM